MVGITRGAPKFKLQYELAGNIIEIAPPGYLFNEYDRARFTPSYFRYMDKTGAAKIAGILAAYEKRGKDVVLCCYEDVRLPNEWCHRLVFAEWWFARTGEQIEELPDPSIPKIRTKAVVNASAIITKPESEVPRKPEVQKESEVRQLSLW